MLASQPSVADELRIECPESAFPNRCYVVGMVPGDEALMEGDLFSIEMAINMAQRAENVDKRIAIAVARTSSTAEADRIRDEKIHTAKLKSKDAQIAFLEDAVERSVWEHPVLWFLGGVAATVIIVGIVEHRPQPDDR